MKIFTLLLIMIAVFVVNIWLYSASEGYRSFLKSFKNEEEISIVNDDYIIEKDEIVSSFEDNLEKKVDLWKTVKQEVGNIVEVTPENKPAKQLVMSEYEKEILFLFKDYNLTKLYSHWDLFELTDEYPDEYFEYYSPDVTLLMFSTKSYQEVKIILQTIWGLENFWINEVDNFWEESFYINVDKGFDDGNVRIVFSDKWKVFWLKISKNEYNNVKNILKGL